MSRSAPLVAGGVVAGTLASVVGLALMVGGAASSAPAGGLLGAGLRPGSIPFPGLVSWVEKSGGLCAAVSPGLIAAQIGQESSWNPAALSPTGAEGLSQFEPGTWPQWGADDAGDGNVSPLNPIDAIMAQGRYDCALAGQVAAVAAKSGISVTALMLAAYNAGPGAVLAAGGIPQIIQTEQYVPAILAEVPFYSASLAGPGGSGLASGIVAVAEGELSVPYVWGGGSSAGPTNGGFDCSGLVLFAVYQASGGRIDLPHLSEAQVTLGQPVAAGPGGQVLPSGALQAGDIIGFALGAPGNFDHIGIYIGNGQMIDAPQTGQSVHVDQLTRPYWANVPWSVRRFG